MIDWLLERPPLALAILAIVVAVCVYMGIHVNDQARFGCFKAGGSWQVVRETTVFVHAGNVIVPTTVEEYGCVK